MTIEVRAIGVVRSSLSDVELAPRQADEGAPGAWLVVEASVLAGLHGIRVGDDLVLVTWLHRARRDVLMVHPRGDETRAQQGVFSTRSPHRPNPIGLHEVRVTAVEADRLRVDGLEAIDGTPILDLKPRLDPSIAAR